MILGSLVDAGLSMAALERELRKLPLSGWSIAAAAVHKLGLGATYVDVDVPGEDGRCASHRHEEHSHRHLTDVLEILDAAGFSAPVREAAAGVFGRLAQSEARVHRQPVGDIAFHEVGQIDAIVDIAGAAIGLQLLGIDKVYCAPVPCGRGTVNSSHGALPSPPPATLELLRDAPTYAVDIDAELVTPTGAAILTHVASFSRRPAMTLRSIGYGAGRSDFPFANVLRITIGETSDASDLRAPDGDGGGASSVEQIATNVDDMNPQLYQHVIERVFSAGACDVWLEPAHMKKQRPGVVLSALAPAEVADAVIATIFAETTTIGVRRWTVQRATLPRAAATAPTRFGPVAVKIVSVAAGDRARAEYEECRRIASRTGIALSTVMADVDRDVAAWLESRDKTAGCGRAPKTWE
ncbi:MAG: nickel pincer cofactor biosynthesis protein LarC [Candidatus Eremiobacteraeota bacterium]|nr:nickel pincer cofactor biosynthesis protein LarC [Candidatus Eremiobacteraeota bacterium]